MTIKPHSDMPVASRIVDLRGPDGNAFVLMGIAKEYACQLEWEDDKITEMLDDMQFSDYDNLVDVFDSHFGSFVTLYK